ncbi:DcaP family trimeric outer membrane transporter [Croceicoccus sp. BE223]|uniref:DcaP family trimeric outer membrane transporter n=1 Tax=Croceicoccus sp. BE223 TaxID=2817716 RepID=UPI0028596F68|nr:DcaP family trimeric outer membrane transporter [Croceicoccus sp. BE223]MDR7103306.1 outer membrane murein-binding lipoprotein Lpp [Croceicoccus sp. BE223]
MARQLPRIAGVLLTTTALLAPGSALAQTARESELEARLERLESEMQALRADLAASRAAQNEAVVVAQAAQAGTEETAKKLAALESRPVPEGFRVGSTTVKMGGFIKLVASHSTFSEGEVANNSLGRDFYLPQTIPVGAGPSSTVQDVSAKQSRFWLNLATDVAGHTLKGLVEADFQTSPGTQGSQRTTNGYNLTLRRAFLQFDKLTFGQDWTTFQYTGALPETTDFVGGAEGTVFVRQPLIRYSAPVGKTATLHLGVENPESGTAVAGAPALVENGDDRIPDFTARLALAPSFGELSLAGLVRQVRVETGGVAADATGWAVSGGGKLFLNDAKTSDIRALVTYGHNAGRYIGLNFAPDAVFVPATGDLASVDEIAAIVAARIALSPVVRVNLMGSYQKVDYANSLTLSDIGGFNKEAWSAATNVFYSPVKNVDLGIEYRRGNRELVNGADGTLDRVEFAAKYSF